MRPHISVSPICSEVLRSAASRQRQNLHSFVQSEKSENSWLIFMDARLVETEQLLHQILMSKLTLSWSNFYVGNALLIKSQQGFQDLTLWIGKYMRKKF